MQWRLLVRRNPQKSFTIVGDVAQASAAAASTSWADALQPLFADNWRLEELTVNYRTPAQIAETAESMAIAHGLSITRSRSVRSSEWPVAVLDTDDMLASVVEAVESDRAIDALGTIAVIASESLVDAITERLVETLGTEVGRGAAGLNRSVAVLTPQESKGLEFDAAVVVEPQLVIDEISRGAAALYVAMTRPTQRLHLVTTTELPAGIVR